MSREGTPTGGRPEKDLDWSVRTNIGQKRSSNEDSVAALSVRVGGSHWGNGLHDILALVVADGMGGQSSGEVASELSTRVLLKELSSRLVERIGHHVDYAPILRKAFEEANQRVYEKSLMPEFQGMGTTLVAAVVDEGQLTVANVGDSRAYLIRTAQREVRQVTKDHSEVQEKLDRGELRPEEAENYPRKNVVTRNIGTDPPPTVDVFSVPMGDGHLLLCSDGLTKMLSNDEILSCIIGDAAGSTQRLVDRANERGGTDNISVALVREVLRSATIDPPPA